MVFFSILNYDFHHISILILYHLVNIQNLNTTESWPCWHQSIGAANAMFLNLTNAPASSTQYNSTAPTSTVFSVGATDGNNQSGSNHIDYVWCEIDGFSKFGKYTGNGVVDGPFVYTGFKPRWVLHKANNAASWYIYDTVREKNNPLLFPLFADTNVAESSNVYGIDFLSNGFKLRQPTGYGANYSGVDVYYMAFAEHPFVGDGTSPVTAR